MLILGVLINHTTLFAARVSGERSRDRWRVASDMAMQRSLCPLDVCEEECFGMGAPASAVQLHKHNFEVRLGAV